MFTFMFICSLITPLLFLIVGIVMMKNPASEVNYFVGFRTKTTMSSQANWDFAQKMFPKIWIALSLILLCLTSILMVIFSEKMYLVSIICIILQLVILCATPIYIVERNLKNKKI